MDRFDPCRWRWPRFSLSWLLIFVLGLATGLAVWRHDHRLWFAIRACFVAWLAVGLVQSCLAGIREWRAEYNSSPARQAHLWIAILWPLAALGLLALFAPSLVVRKIPWPDFRGDGLFIGSALRDSMLYLPVLLAFSGWQPRQD